MANFAEINKNDIVIRVLAVSNDALDANNEEQSGSQFLTELLGGTWIQTSYNSNIRGTYAGIGYSYNEAEDIFITPPPYPSWVRNGSFWDAPILMPTEDGKFYKWVEADLNWQEISFNDSQ
jgi:hypothetical protein